MARSARIGSSAWKATLALVLAVAISSCSEWQAGFADPGALRPILSDADIDAATWVPSSEVTEIVGTTVGDPDAGSESGVPEDPPRARALAQDLPADASGHLVYVEHDPGAADPWRLVLVQASTDARTLLYQGAREIQSATATVDGSVVAFAMRHVTGGHFEIYAYTTATGAVTRLTSTAHDNLDVSASADGGVLAWSGIAGNGRRTVVLRIRSGSSVVDTVLATDTDQIQPSLSGDGRYVALVRPGGRYYILIYDRLAETYTTATSRGSEISYPSVSDGANHLAWYIPSHRTVRLRYVTGTGTITAVKHWAALDHPFLTSDAAYLVFGQQTNGSLAVHAWSHATGAVYQASTPVGSAQHVAATWHVGDVATVPLSVAVEGSGTVTSRPAGIACNPTCTAEFPSGTTVSLTATPAAGWAFQAWTGACTGTGGCAVELAAATSVTATFVENPTEPRASLAPVSTTCDGSASGQTCQITVALQGVTGSFEGLEFRFASTQFEIVRANAAIGGTAGDCLADAGPDKVIVVCSEPFPAAGSAVLLTVARTGSASTTVATTDAFLAIDASHPLVAVDGGVLAISGSD